MRTLHYVAFNCIQINSVKIYNLSILLCEFEINHQYLIPVGLHYRGNEDESQIAIRKVLIIPHWYASDKKVLYGK